jgi:DNA-binding helix-hairpin-helix protein with protein kinase domain
VTSDLVLARSKAPVQIGPELARGGEGAVHTLLDSADKLLKLYLKPPEPDKLVKLQVMTEAGQASLMNVAAWPAELVIDKQGRTRGFVMRKAASSAEAHQLYTPKSRAQSFPEADFRFLLHVAANVVRAFGVVHQAGYVIGDVNHAQVLVGRDGRVTLIDCDSFQVEARGRLYTCDVGSPLFTPPELQGRSFRGLPRTADHDRFGLAVLLFQMLFMGRHPYAGVPLDSAQSTEIEAAIKADRFAYGEDRRTRGVEQPPGTLPLSVYGAGVADLFERAFARSPVTVRPDESTWLDQLKALQNDLMLCAVSPAHHHPRFLASCPWCAIEARTGGRLFGQQFRSTAFDEVIDIAALWKPISAIRPPKKAVEPITGSYSLPPRSKPERARQLLRTVRRIVAIGVGFAVYAAVGSSGHILQAMAAGAVTGSLAWPRVKAAQRQAAKRAAADARAAYDDVRRRWTAAASGQAFLELRQRCADAKDELEQLPVERTRRLAALIAEAKQLEDFLDRFRIAQEKISGIGPGRAATLASFGIETAWDITGPAVKAIPGFGPATADKLLVWRASKQRQFIFNPHYAAPAAEIKAIESEISARRQALASMLRSGPALMQQALREGEQVLAATEPLLKERWIDWCVAKRKLRDL